MSSVGSAAEAVGVALHPAAVALVAVRRPTAAVCGAMGKPKAFPSGHDAVSRVANKEAHTVAAHLRLLFMALVGVRVFAGLGGYAVSEWKVSIPCRRRYLPAKRQALCTLAPMAVAGTRESWDNGGLTFGPPSVGGGAEVRGNP